MVLFNEHMMLGTWDIGEISIQYCLGGKWIDYVDKGFLIYISENESSKRSIVINGSNLKQVKG